MTERPSAPIRSALLELTLARVRLFVREPGALFWTFGFPLVLAIALGIAFRNRPPAPVLVGIEEGPGAEALSAALQSDELKGTVLSSEAAHLALRSGRVALVVVPGAVHTYRYDDTRAESRLARLLVRDRLERAAGRVDLTRVTDAHMSEPGARYIDFLIPGLAGLTLMSSSMWGIGYLIVDMRTKKLIKRMLATPMRKRDFLLSFVVMRALFVVLELPVLFGFGWIAFGVRVTGSLSLLLGVSLLGALSFAGLGILVASRAENTQTIGGLMNVVMMPMFVGSGVFFTSSRFPEAVQPFIHALPLTALNDALRAIVNEGAGPAAVARPCALLAGCGIASFALALKLFRWR